MTVHSTASEVNATSPPSQHGTPLVVRTQDRMFREHAVERVTRIELAFSAWEADVLPLNYTRRKVARHSGTGAGFDAASESGWFVDRPTDLRLVRA